jgi:ribosome-associated protein
MTRRTVEQDLRLAQETLEAHKAVDLVTLDLRKLSDATDYFLIASGTSDTHVRALARRLIDAFEQAHRKPHHVEGLSGGRWVLLDFVDFVVHVFHPTLRDFYQLERLWADAPVVATGSGG